MAAPVLESTATRVAGNFHPFIAPLGTTLPSTAPTVVDAPAGFVSLGYTGPDGATFRVQTETQDLFAHQSDDPLRTLVTSRRASMDITLLEWDSDTLVTALGGGTVVSNVYRPPASGTIEEYAFCAYIVDGADLTLIVAERVFIAGSIEASLSKTDWATLPITVTFLAPVEEASSWAIIDSTFESTTLDDES